VPTFTCGLVRSNFALAIGRCPYPLILLMISSAFDFGTSA
jgi:hypothetical protein